MSEKRQSDSAFEQRTREVLEESAARLDGRTLSKLTQARHGALDQLQRPVRLGWRAWIPAVAAAAVAVLAVTMWPAGTTSETANPLEDLEIIADAEAPDFFDEGEDLEFYEWAAAQMESGEVES